jgi:4-alpha-glucanotransferase
MVFSVDMAGDAGADIPRCYLPDWLEEARIWGISLQLYELRSRRNWGIGDFADLATFCDIAAEAGADFVGLNPLHALFLSDPERCSPFSPSTRRFLNPLYIAVDDVPGFQRSDALIAKARTLAALETVDYREVTALKITALRQIWAEDRWRDVDGANAAFDRYCDAGGEALRLHALFEALSAEMSARGAGAGWRGWPEGYASPGTEAVARFAREQADEIRFQCWLQWLCEAQLDRAAALARRAGMRVGLYLDLSVGEAPDGSATWTDREAYVVGQTIGAPPDYFSAHGQDWGLTPLSPDRLARSGCEAFESAIDAAMRHGGALRIDHAMALERLFFVPEGQTPASGRYVDYPAERMIETLAAASMRNLSLVIGEDLGVVPSGFRERMEKHRILSYRIAYFEKQDERFTPAQSYPDLAIACLSTHDLAPLRAWWRGDDIRLRKRVGAIDEAMATEQKAARAVERAALVDALEASGAVTSAQADGLRGDAGGAEASDLPKGFAAAMHRFIALTPSKLAAARLADLSGDDRPTNLPGTVEAYPNWRFKCPVALEDLPRSELFSAITGALSSIRPKAS